MAKQYLFTTCANIFLILRPDILHRTVVFRNTVIIGVIQNVYCTCIKLHLYNIHIHRLCKAHLQFVCTIYCLIVYIIIQFYCMSKNLYCINLYLILRLISCILYHQCINLHNVLLLLCLLLLLICRVIKNIRSNEG